MFSFNIWQKIFVALWLVTLVFLAFYGNTASIWLDEAYSVFLAKLSFGEILSELQTDAHPPLYYFLLKIWVAVFGEGEFAVRSLSGIFYLSAVFVVFVVFRCGKHLTRHNLGGFLAAFVYSLSPLATGTAHAARMYALLGFIAALSTRQFLQICDDKQDSVSIRKATFFYILVNIGGTFTQIWFFFALAGQMLTSLFFFERHNKLRIVVAQTLSVVPFFALWTPTLLKQMSYAPTDWLGRANLTDLLRVTLGLYGEKIALVFVALLLLCLLPSRLISQRKKRGVEELFADSDWTKSEKRFGWITFSLTASTILIPFLLAQFLPVFGQTRYAIVALPALALFTGLLLKNSAKPPALVAFCLILLATTTYAFGKYHSQPEVCSDRTAAEYLSRRLKQDDIVIFTSLSKTPLEIYLHRNFGTKFYYSYSFPAELDTHRGWRNPRRMLENIAEIDVEAIRLTDEIKKIFETNPTAKVWLFDGLDAEINDRLREKLTRDFALDEIQDFSCQNAGGRTPQTFFTRLTSFKR